MKRRVAEVGRFRREITVFPGRYSVPFLQVSLGLVFLGFGLTTAMARTRTGWRLSPGIRKATVVLHIV